MSVDLGHRWDLAGRGRIRRLVGRVIKPPGEDSVGVGNKSGRNRCDGMLQRDNQQDWAKGG